MSAFVLGRFFHAVILPFLLSLLPFFFLGPKGAFALNYQGESGPQTRNVLCVIAPFVVEMLHHSSHWAGRERDVSCATISWGLFFSSRSVIMMILEQLCTGMSFKKVHMLYAHKARTEILIYFSLFIKFIKNYFYISFF